eukprot:TRINITY_DN12440_c0_g2_i1.p2 TRINITY_DN12440_c0_g2~~TRINITY_DN12440_c0_g2_i1.p2  ORF type:complete len:333 (-),score=52.25 TRINITY_DN12440_c0_g2_i1:179-1177(-)
MDWLREKRGGILLGGHRGSGANRTLFTQPPSQNVDFQAPKEIVWGSIRENTLTSILVAHDVGVDFVEFDVQVTSDGVPVLYHDDELITVAIVDDKLETSSQKISEITWDQLNAVYAECFDGSGNFRLCRYDVNRAWTCQVEDHFPCLEDIFQHLPYKDLGLNIEVKMAVGNEVEVTPPEEIKRVLQPILKCVYKFSASKFQILFSSFDPEICKELKSRQSEYPVYFLSTGGVGCEHVDKRRMSLTAAVQVATDFKLDGLVVQTDALLQEQQIMESIKQQGLFIMTYGSSNNSVEVVAQLAKCGVDGLIVDDVVRINKYTKDSELRVSDQSES